MPQQLVESPGDQLEFVHARVDTVGKHALIKLRGEMKTGLKILCMLALLALPLLCEAQCEGGTKVCAGGAPHFVAFNGTLKDLAGLPRRSVVAIRFVIYADSRSGAPLWQEVQNVHVDSHGHYEVMLGAAASQGTPMGLFSSGEPRWLGVQPLLPGAVEQRRVLLVSVPYRLASAYAQPTDRSHSSAFASSAGLDLLLPAETAPVNRQAELSGDAGPETAWGPSWEPSAARPPLDGDMFPDSSSGPSFPHSQGSQGTPNMETLANVVFADWFAGGVPEAINACPQNGCVIYAVSPKVNRGLGTIDPGAKSVTIYLGPYQYTVRQITLRTGLKIIGMGTTSLQSINGNSPVFVVPQDNNDPAAHVLLSGFGLTGSIGNTSEDAFFLDASTTVNSGLWYSTFDDVVISGFAGVGIHLRARNNDFASADQWLLFNNVAVYRTSGGGNALRLEGSVFELRFRNCLFDGQAMGDGTNIYIGGLAAGTGNRGFPLDIVFEGLVSQLAALAVQIDGGVHVSFYDSHHEFLWGGYEITYNTEIATLGLTISNCEFEGTTANNQGAGFDLNITTTQASGVIFSHNQILGSPDAIIKGTNLASVVYQDNMSCGACVSLPTSGITTQISPAGEINIQGVHSVGLNPSTTPITTIQSNLGPGEMVTFFAIGGSVLFEAGGNIDLMGMNSLTVDGTITLVRSDLGGLLWKVVSQWSPRRPLRTPTPASEIKRNSLEAPAN
jgi:hypothetical protein